MHALPALSGAYLFYAGRIFVLFRLFVSNVSTPQIFASQVSGW